MDPNLRANLRHLFIGALYDFASPNMQRLWVEGHPDIIKTFDETMCGWFDDLLHGGGPEAAARNGWLSQQEAEVVQRFHEIADAYEPPPNRNDADVLRDPRWSEVARHAQDAWHALRRTLIEPDELQQMEDLEGRWGAVPS